MGPSPQRCYCVLRVGYGRGNPSSRCSMLRKDTMSAKPEDHPPSRSCSSIFFRSCSFTASRKSSPLLCRARPPIRGTAPPGERHGIETWKTRGDVNWTNSQKEPSSSRKRDNGSTSVSGSVVFVRTGVLREDNRYRSPQTLQRQTPFHRRGRPRHCEERLERISDWFARYLG